MHYVRLLEVRSANVDAATALTRHFSPTPTLLLTAALYTYVTAYVLWLHTFARVQQITGRYRDQPAS